MINMLISTYNVHKTRVDMLEELQLIAALVIIILLLEILLTQDVK